MDSRNFFELVIRKSELEELTPEQKTRLRLELLALEDKLGQILESYGVDY